MQGQKRLSLSLNKRKRCDESYGPASSATTPSAIAESSNCMVSQTQRALDTVVDLCDDEPDVFVAKVTVQTQVSDVTAAEPAGVFAASRVSHCFVCCKDISALPLLEQEVHRNSCLDVTPCEEDWGTQRVQEVDDGDNDGDPDEVGAIVVPEEDSVTEPPPLTKSKSAFEVLMKAARESTAAVAKAALTAVASVTAPFRGYGGATTRPCPFYKRIPGTPLIVDGFHYATKQLSSHYVLTHFHSDHYGGITKQFNAGVIYCSQITATLVASSLGVSPRYIKPLPFNTPTIMEGLNVEVTLMDANHCPGAAIWLFRVFTGTPEEPVNKFYLHVGDFRWNTELMTKFPWLRAVSAGADGKFRVDTLYLDTTYCKPCYTFPTQRAAVDAVIELVLMHCGLDESANATNRLSFDTTSSPPPVSKTLFLFGTYSVGKEKIFMEVARALNEPVCVSAYKFRLISAFGWPPHIMKLVTTDPLSSRLHTVPMGALTLKALTHQLSRLKARATPAVSAIDAAQPPAPAGKPSKTFKGFARSASLDFFVSPNAKLLPSTSLRAPPTPKQPLYTHIVAFKPTGWTVEPPQGEGGWREVRSSGATQMTSAGVKVTVTRKPNITVYGIPYSEHSSFPELQECVRFVDPIKIIPTVNCRSSADSDAMVKLLRLPPSGGPRLDFTQ